MSWKKRVRDLKIIINDLPRSLNVRFDNARDERRAIEARLDIREDKADALPHRTSWRAC